MGIPTFRVALRALFAGIALLAVTAVHAQNLNVTSANSTNDRVFSLNFFGTGGPTATQQNTDAGAFGSLRSLAFIVNGTTSALDLVVADNTAGTIAVYAGDFSKGPPAAATTASVIWKAAQGGPGSPDGLSVDGAGDLWVVNSGSPQLWVFPAAGTGGCTGLPAYVSLCAPVLVDSTYAGGQSLVETTSVPGGLTNTGDLLVLTNNPATVLDYAFTTPGSFGFSRSTLITLPAGTTTGGLAFWPLDNSLLITNETANSILRYSCCSAPVAMANFASKLGGGGRLLYKIKTGYQTGVPYAFAAQAGNVDNMLQLGEGATVTGPGVLLNDISISQGINHPRGLAVSNAASAAAGACSQSSGCNPTGLLSHIVPGSNSPKLVENVCVVPVDPRVTYNGNTWTCNGEPLPVNSVCPGFDTTGTGMFIPGYMCGMSGDSAASTPQGFTLIKTLTNNGAFDKTIIENVIENLANEPACLPGGTLLWAPVAGEGTFVADRNTNETLELTDGCGTIHGGSSGGSLWGEGLALNTASTTLAMLADQKYVDLETTIETELAANITNVAGQLASAGGTGCVPLSKSYFDFAQFETGSQQGLQDLTIAADLLANTCDTIVTTNLNDFTQTPNSSPPVFNPSGQVRSRLANLYFTINSRILGNPPNASAPSWPPSPQLAAPPGLFTNNACVAPNQATEYPPPGGCPTISVNPASVQAGGNVTVSWSLFGSTPCALNSGGGDSVFTGGAVTGTSGNPMNAGSQSVTATATAGTYTYTLACSGPEASSVTAQLTVTAPPLVPVVVIVNPTSANDDGARVQISWTAQTGASGCNLTDNGAGVLGGITTGNGGATHVARYNTAERDDGKTIVFTATCTGALPGSGTLSVHGS